MGSRAADLHPVLDGMGEVAVAVSGGVDSMTLAVVAHRRLGHAATLVHAISPAVPPEATARVRAYARREGWRLEVIDAGEFRDEKYLANPANRCFFCKTNLYGTIAARTRGTILSGTNLDDLAELPAAPCLSSRLETGIGVTVERLRLVHAVERLIGRELTPKTVRCRILHDGIVIQLDPDGLTRACDQAGQGLRAAIQGLLAEHGRTEPVRFESYRMGSAFHRPAAHGR